MDPASTYLIDEYRKAGYVQTFTYPKFEDLGSNLSVGKTTIEGGIEWLASGQPTAPLVAVLMWASRRASVDVKGAIAIVRRGEIRFLKRLRMQRRLVGLTLVNTEPGNISGTLGGE